MGFPLVPKWLVCVVVSVLILHSDESSGCLEKEKLALLQIKEQFSSFLNDPGLLPSWSNESFHGNCCLWERVRCHPSSSHIIELSLGSLTVPDFSSPWALESSFNMTVFQDLDKLQSLDLSTNYITHLVEVKAMCKLRSLQVLNLSRNYLEGGLIPDCIGNLSFLEKIDLSYNSLTGDIPSGICNLKRLQVLDLSGNKLKGNISPGICSLKRLQVLDLSWNDFEGSLPICIYNMSSFEYLSLSGNEFKGNISPGVCNLKKLKTLDISWNGSLPGCIGNMSSLQHLSLYSDGFSGSLISGVCNLKKLKTLFIESWNGSLPGCIGNMSSLQHLSLNSYGLSGGLESGLCKLAKLERLELDGDYSRNNLPSCVGNLTSLRDLILPNSNLSGTLPPGLCKLVKLQILDLSENTFLGSLPTCIGKLTSLKQLDLSRNQFAGKFSLSLLSKHANLTDLDLSDNKLEIETEDQLWIPSFQLKTLALRNCSLNKENNAFPKFLSHQYYLCYLDLSENGLIGSFPASLIQSNSQHDQNLTSQSNSSTRSFQFSRHRNISSSIIPTIFKLNLSCNQLSGQISPDLGYFKETYSLDLSHNKLNGLIPETFSMLSNIWILDLSYNNLSGPIPAEFVKLNFLEVFNVSYNNLSGRVPLIGQSANFDVSSYEGNPFLSGYDQGRNPTDDASLNPSFGEDKENTGFDWELFLWCFGPSCNFFLVASIVVAYNNPQWLNACLISMDAYMHRWYLSLY